MIVERSGLADGSLKIWLKAALGPDLEFITVYNFLSPAKGVQKSYKLEAKSLISMVGALGLEPRTR